MKTRAPSAGQAPAPAPGGPAPTRPAPDGPQPGPASNGHMPGATPPGAARAAGARPQMQQMQQMRLAAGASVPGAAPVGAPGTIGAMGGRRMMKRLLLGRALATSQLRHERLGKPTALAIFASDNLSSVAYATEEILRVFFAAGLGAAAFGFLLPISGAILLVLATLLFSYRQTIRAYPTAGGAYIVTKDNFGLLPAQIAGVALLTDYVLTVAVSVAAGVQALTSAFPGLYAVRVAVACAIIVLIAWGNLRGVRESGRIFAAPTYFFIGSMIVLLVTGLVRLATGTLQPVASSYTWHASTTQVVGLFLILQAFASGGAAVTGVEAISNGVPAFKPPEWRNARMTLMWMGTTLGAMFLGLSVIARAIHVVPDPTEKVSIVAQVARQVFGSGAVGHVLFFVIQGATMLILVLAANTSFADFPRLANFHAADMFLPRQFTKRGHRLVFSNGIIALAAASMLLVVAFGASVTRLIPFYAIGVFTSFTLSQAGMARRHLRIREPGWKRGLAINGFGAVATGVVDVVIGLTKFSHGAWAVIVLVPVMVVLLVRMNRAYESEATELEEGLRRFDRSGPERTVVVVVVDRVDAMTLHAVRFAKTVVPDELCFLHLAADPAHAAGLAAAWDLMDVGAPLTIVGVADRRDRSREACLRAWLTSKLAARASANGSCRETTTVVLPAPARVRAWDRIRHGRPGERITRALADLGNVNVAVVRDPGPAHPAVGCSGGARSRIVIRPQHVALVLVDHVDRSVLRAIRYAQAIRPTEIRCLHVAIDPEHGQKIFDRWAELRVPVPLESTLCEDRDLGLSLTAYVTRLVSDPEVSTHVTVVVPRRDSSHAWHRLLHDRTRRAIFSALSAVPGVAVAVVPYHLGGAASGAASGPRKAAPAGAPAVAGAMQARRP